MFDFLFLAAITNKELINARKRIVTFDDLLRFLLNPVKVRNRSYTYVIVCIRLMACNSIGHSIFIVDANNNHATAWSFLQSVSSEIIKAEKKYETQLKLATG